MILNPRLVLTASVLAVSVIVSGCANSSPSGTSTNSSSGTVTVTQNQTYYNPSSGGFLEPTSSAPGAYYYDTANGQYLLPTGGNTFYNPTTGGYVVGNAASISGQTKDVDLQQAQLEQSDLQSRAQAAADRFGMNLQSAVQLTQLADRMKALTSGGKQMTAQDEAALLDAAYKVVGVSGAAVNAAAAKYIQTGDESAANELLNQAATNLGMSSSAALRDEILPSLGIHLK